jgi:hypothetical protein
MPHFLTFVSGVMYLVQEKELKESIFAFCTSGSHRFEVR